MQDIAQLIGKEQVAKVVSQFYQAIRQHETLKEPFLIVADWPHHEEILTHFWWVTLGGERYLDYTYQVAPKHMQAGFTPALLVDWLALFEQTISQCLPADLATPWLERAHRIGKSLVLLHQFHADNQVAIDS
ncbi:hemoglobin [Chitinivorax tropicus]|uniref:Hemoglobin n=1 Tax=Chitinivorax tropicus TaxID=714531 RepID=A0A840MLT6_9PROT|nr:group III truncated hemoglobin [Chitinivorax tropicus]MBB5017496.1 hemoglobin [Chitinivorax tropicus]